MHGVWVWFPVISAHCAYRDFYIWTFAYDVSGVKNVTFYYRKDNDGENPHTDSANEVYHSDLTKVSDWSSMPMTHRVFPKVGIAIVCVPGLHQPLHHLLDCAAGQCVQ